MNIFFIILASVFALMTIGEKRTEYKKIYSECFFASVVGTVLFLLVQGVIGVG